MWPLLIFFYTAKRVSLASHPLYPSLLLTMHINIHLCIVRVNDLLDNSLSWHSHFYSSERVVAKVAHLGWRRSKVHREEQDDTKMGDERRETGSKATSHLRLFHDIV